MVMILLILRIKHHYPYFFGSFFFNQRNNVVLYVREDFWFVLHLPFQAIDDVGQHLSDLFLEVEYNI